ncbi:MAG: crotonase/enoyl-CoA hydratase family protein, partial [Myxococcales bacterium]|nr:crotonase/enoyl-CoA hydratase family protein [Myxococcales bacterium]
MTNDALVSYALEGGIARIRMDDGKANVMSAAMLGQLNEALDRAQEAQAVVVLEGRERMFSAGYDMAMFQRPADEIVATIRAGGELVTRMLDFPRPVVAACTGHAIAQGAFTLLAADVRIGVAGSFKLGLNEVAIGLTIPHYGVELARHRLAAPFFDHATMTGMLYPPERAREAGFRDEVGEAAELHE